MFQYNLKLKLFEHFELLNLLLLMNFQMKKFQQNLKMKKYNEYLYKSGRQQLFSDNNGKWEATILNTNNDGTISVQMENGTIVSYYHGQVLWEWR